MRVRTLGHILLGCAVLLLAGCDARLSMARLLAKRATQGASESASLSIDVDHIAGNTVKKEFWSSLDKHASHQSMVGSESTGSSSRIITPKSKSNRKKVKLQ